MKCFAEIINIGTEVVTGITVNSNGAYIARKLSSLGITVRRITAIPDNEEDIRTVMVDSLRRSNNIIVITGGLGPTYDDITAEVISRVLGRPLEINERALSEVRDKYEKRSLEITKERLKMAMMPQGAIPISNSEGIAPGIYLNLGEIEILATPGVPREMEAVLENFLNNFLKCRGSRVRKETFITVKGVMESEIAPCIKTVVKNHPNVYIKTHPRGKELEEPHLIIQISGSSDEEDYEKEYERIIEKIGECINQKGGKFLTMSP